MTYAVIVLKKTSKGEKNKMRKRRYTSERCNNNKNYLIWDNETGECLGFIAQIVGRLNLQEDIIKEQKTKIRQLEETIRKGEMK